MSQLTHHFINNTFIYFFLGTTAFDIFGADNAKECLTCGFQYQSLPISILHFVARIFGRKWYNFVLLNAFESGKHQNLLAFFTLVNITYNFSKVRVGLPGVCSSKAIRAPLGARAYPWILSKYFLCVRVCVCPPTD